MAANETGAKPTLHDRVRALTRRRWFWPAVAGLVVVLLVAPRMWRVIVPARDPFWERIQATGRWRVAMDASFPPFEDLNEAGQPEGFDVDLAQAIAARWGVQVQIEGIGFDGLVDAVQASRVDTAISALPYQPQLTQDVAFSQPYFEAGLVLVAPAGDQAVQTVDDLAGRRLAVEWGSEGDVQARALRRRYPDLQILPNETAQDALQAVADGSADAALVDRISALQTAGAMNNAIRIAPQAVVSDPYVVVLPRKAPMLQQQVSEALRALEADGTLDALTKKWLIGE
jgi:ABC-type amino acid transport substrate-binding protein